MSAAASAEDDTTSLPSPALTNTTTNDLDDDTLRTSMTTLPPKPALVFGASGEQGRAVLEGFVDAGYYPIYAFSRHNGTAVAATTTNNVRSSHYSQQIFNDQYLSEALGCILLTGDIANPDQVRLALTSTKAQAIFLVTTTDLPEQQEHDVAEGGGGGTSTTVGGYKVAMDAERDVILQFFQILKEVYQEDKLHRTVVFSTRDNVQDICHKELQTPGAKPWVEPLDDGSIVPHYSGTSAVYSSAFSFLIPKPNVV